MGCGFIAGLGDKMPAQQAQAETAQPSEEDAPGYIEGIFHDSSLLFSETRDHVACVLAKMAMRKVSAKYLMRNDYCQLLRRRCQ